MATADSSACSPQKLAPLPAAKSAQNLTQQQGQVIDSPSDVCEWMPTSLRLPSHDAEREEIYLRLPVHLPGTSSFKKNEENEEYNDDGYCRDAARKLRLLELDRYLAAVVPLALSTQRLLFGVPVAQNNDCKHESNPERQLRPFADRPRKASRHLVTSTNCGRVINVLQGEIAHCTSLQAEVLISDDATTCHIVALWSRFLGTTDKGQKNIGTPIRTTVEDQNRRRLGTMTHIDGPGYDTSIRDAINEHIKYHSVHGKQNVTEECKYQKDSSGDMIELSIHIMGGFTDEDGRSIEITDSILRAIAALSDECNAYSISRGLSQVRMTLETCAVTSANDDGTGSPLGRGLAMETATGKIFLAEIEDAIMHRTASSYTSTTTYYTGMEMVAADSEFKAEVTSSSNKMRQLVKRAGAIAARCVWPPPTTRNEAQSPRATQRPINAQSSDGDLIFPNSDVGIMSAQGPGVTLRSVRLWASTFHPRGGKQESRLNVIHRPDRDYLCIEPFFFGPHPAIKGLLDYSDDELLQITSTSPGVEKSNFVSKVREAFEFMNGTSCEKVFVRNQPAKFQRVGMNGWIRTETES